MALVKFLNPSILFLTILSGYKKAQYYHYPYQHVYAGLAIFQAGNLTHNTYDIKHRNKQYRIR